MNILYTLNSGRPGGMEQHVADLVREMHARGHKVFVWCRDGEIVNWYKAAGATVDIKNIGFDLDPIYIVALAKFLKAQSIDIIHAHELLAVTNSTLAGWLAGTKVRITHVHTPMSQWQLPMYKRAYNFFKLFGYSILVKLFISREIALTESIKNIKISEGIPETKLVVIPNGLQTENYKITPVNRKAYRDEICANYNIPTNAFIFGCVGRLTEEKGHEVLVKAFAEFLKYQLVSKETVYLLLAGGGALEAKIKTLCTTLGIGSKVVITGIFDAADKLKLFSAMDVFVFPSLAEGFGIVLIEAMAQGIPAIVSDLDVLQEVGGSCCFYFDKGNSTSLAEKMVDIYSKKANLENIKEASVLRVNDLFTMEKFADAYEQLYFELLEKK